MSELVTLLASWSAALLEAIGVSVMTLIAVYALVHAVIRLLRKEDSGSVFTEVRQRVGKGILLGLEFLIAADIIKTVVIAPTFKSVGVLGAIILVRTFLSFTLELEINKRWPWQEDPPSETERI